MGFLRGRKWMEQVYASFTPEQIQKTPPERLGAAWSIGNEYGVAPSEVLEGGPDVYGRVCLGAARKNGYGEDENGQFEIPEDVMAGIALFVRGLFEEQGLFHGLDEDDEDEEDNEADTDQVEAASPQQVADAPKTDQVELITKLGQLREAGLLTDDEFEAKKAEILARM